MAHPGHDPITWFRPLPTMAPHALESSVYSPPVVLIHGVGLGPSTFALVVTALARRHRAATAVTRNGYGPTASASDEPLALQVDRIGALIEEIGAGPAVWVGVSGGATLGVLALERIRPLLAAVVIHEPLMGSVVPELRDVLTTRAARLQARRGTAAVVEFVHDLVGPDGWEKVGPEQIEAIPGYERAIRHEVPRFVAFEPDGSEGAGSELPVVVSVGERSPELRHRSATRAATWLGGRTTVLPGVGHLAHVEDPDGFAALIDQVIGDLAAPQSRSEVTRFRSTP